MHKYDVLIRPLMTEKTERMGSKWGGSETRRVPATPDAS